VRRRVAYRCYLVRVATAAELRRFVDPEDDMESSMFLCRGCRS
jgi:hypothetical protein